MRFRRLELALGICFFFLGLFFIIDDFMTAKNFRDREEAEIDQIIESHELEETAPAEESDTENQAEEGEKPPSFNFDLMRPKSGDTFYRFLLRIGVPKTSVNKVIKDLSPHFKAKMLKTNQAFYVSYSYPEETDPLRKKPEKIVFYPTPKKRICINVDYLEDKESCTVGKPEDLESSLKYYHGEIQNSLYQDAIEAGLSNRTINDLLQTFSYSVDFQRGIHPGDTFEVLVKEYVDPETNISFSETPEYAALYVKDDPQVVYKFKEPGFKHAKYYDERGRSAKKDLLKTPLDGGRISSRYGKRKHPILGYTRLHRGVDFAAPRGTPVRAAGDGVIEKVGRLGSYGNYVLVRHTPEYKTAYAHLHRFPKGIKRGGRVKQRQIIGYVGSTGMATAPHLHYEVHFKGRQINPEKITRPPRQSLHGKTLEKFTLHRKKMDKIIEELKADKVPPT